MIFREKLRQKLEDIVIDYDDAGYIDYTDAGVWITDKALEEVIALIKADVIDVPLTMKLDFNDPARLPDLRECQRKVMDES